MGHNILLSSQNRQLYSIVITEWATIFYSYHRGPHYSTLITEWDTKFKSYHRMDHNILLLAQKRPQNSTVVLDWATLFYLSHHEPPYSTHVREWAKLFYSYHRMGHSVLLLSQNRLLHSTLITEWTLNHVTMEDNNRKAFISAFVQ
jgi:hypothetical protein